MRAALHIVMAVLVTAIHVLSGQRECMDGRDKPGQDESGSEIGSRGPTAPLSALAFVEIAAAGRA
ncbi:MAG: hypothetical protein ACRCVA_02105, partial [Phreatobacter sp.]